MIAYMQKIGRALMVPVAVLPVAALLMGIGYWIDPVGWGANSALAALLIGSGSAVLDNLGIIFAVGIAYGLSKDKNGAAALAALVGFLILNKLLTPDFIAMFQGIPVEEVSAGFNKNMGNTFFGILVGITAGEIYNKFHKVELPTYLAFFSGRRLVPIITAIAMIFISVLLMFIWPFLYDGLVAFGEWMVGLGAVGAGLFGFFNRLLVPFGLHHALNSVFWFDVAGINDIGNFLAGEGTPGVTGMYQAGFFPIMMGGLLGAALAIYKTAKPQHKARVGSLMLSGAAASFLTGVTEPLEFSFMFVAPVLYFIHAVLTGLSMFIAASMGWMAGFGFSAGLIDLLLSSQNPMATKWYMLIPMMVAFFAIYYVIFRFMIVKFDYKTPGREDDEEFEGEESAELANNNYTEFCEKLLPLVGGKENLVQIDNCTTRLRLSVKDSSIVDEAAIKKLGAAGVVKPSKTALQIIIGPQVEFVADAFKQVAK